MWSLRVLGPHLKRFAVFFVWSRRLHLFFRARSYHNAAEHLETIPKWKDASHFRALVTHEWSTWINCLVLKFQFVAAERLLLNPLEVIEEPVLAKLKVLFISRLRASLVLKKVLEEHALTLRK